MYGRQIYILISFLASGLCLECYRCYYASDPALCRHHVTCAGGQSCSQQRFDDYTGVHYDLDCIETSACHRTDRTDLPNILGKRGQNMDVLCCNTDLCRIDSTSPITNMTTSAALTSSIESSTDSGVKTTMSSDACVDHPDCDILLNEFDACNDSYVAMTVCRKSCDVCDVTTDAPSCFDVHQDCLTLSEHLNVCENDNFARTRCARTCGVCGSTTSSWTYTTTTESTNSSEITNTTEPVEPTNITDSTNPPPTRLTSVTPDTCIDREDCVLLREINVCSSPMTAQLCPDYCGLCLNGSETVNVTFTTELVSSTQSTTPDTPRETTTETTTKQTSPCVDTLSSTDCSKVLSDNPSGCLDAIIKRMCAFTCKVCETFLTTATEASFTTSSSTTTLVYTIIEKTTTQENGAMGVVVVG